MAKENNISKVASAWINCVNPLRNLTKNDIERMLEQIKYGNDVRLQVAFHEMERNMPIFGICLNKRIAGVLSRKWTIEPIDDSSDSIKQAEDIKNIFLMSDAFNIDGLTEAIRHLCLGSFRGRSIVKPFVENNILKFKCIDNWNVLNFNNHLYWNPNADQGVNFLNNNNTLEEIPNSEVCWISDSRPIDIPGIQIYLRQLVGEETWAKAVEKYGIAQVLITAPEGTPDSAMNEWTARAYKIFEGGSGVLPNGADVKTLTEARAQDPFSEYVQHQMEMIAILATGGALATIGGNTGLGSNLADVQNDQFNLLISQDCKKISNTFTEVAIKKALKEILHYNGDIKCRFSFIEDEDTNPNEYLDMAQKAYNMGFKIDVEEFKKLTGLTFIKSDINESWIPKEKVEETKEWTPSEKETLKDNINE